MKKNAFLLFVSLSMLSACELNDTDNAIKAIEVPNKLLSQIILDDKLSTEFIYDDENKLIQLKKYYSDTITYNEFYEYDAQNRLVKREFAGFIESYNYLDNGQLASTTKYYEATHKEWKIEYQYVMGRINKGISYFNGAQSGTIDYKYDANGNTIERTLNANEIEHEKYIFSQYKLRYDEQILPIKDLSTFPIDIVQRNNPTYSYHYEATMSMLPPEFEITYEYDSTGLPLKAYIGSSIREYIYIEIEPF